MWIADMDFAAPQVVIDAIKERLDHVFLAILMYVNSCKDAVRLWLAERHAWETKNEWMLFHHGVVPAIASVIETLQQKGMAFLSHHQSILHFSKFLDYMERNDC